jgi:hypothetical protein
MPGIIPRMTVLLPERTVTFYADGEPLRGVLTSADGAEGLPGIVLCHGFLCTMAMGLPEMAQLLAAEGFAVLRFDYRGFGESGGEQRGALWPLRQVQDARAAVAFLQSQPEADPLRVALWGTSFGGAVVLQAGALDPAVQAVVASVPVTDGGAWLRAVNSEAEWAALLSRLDHDRRQRAVGGASEVVPVTAVRPPAPGPDADRDAFFSRYGHHAPPRELPLECVQAVLDFTPNRLAGLIAPRPLLLVAAPADTTVPLSQAESAHAHAQEPKRLALLPDDVSHFAVYDGAARNLVLAETVAWLRAAPALAPLSPA